MERRRSDRVKLTIPLRLYGAETSETFECEARTIDLNRHGARIVVSRVLHGGEIVRVVNRANRREARFRVAGPVAPPTPEGGSYGVLGPISAATPTNRAYGIECLDTTQNFWGITFPQAEDEPFESKALLECRQCNGVSLLRLSLVEIDVLQSSGILPLPCETCRTSTPWGYAVQEALEGFDAKAQPRSSTDSLSFRRYRRISLQLPVRIRCFSGNVEITKSENVSKSGICFVSDRLYYIGERVLVACPYREGTDNIEVEGEIVRQDQIPDTNRKVYGLRYRVRDDQAKRVGRRDEGIGSSEVRK